MSQSVPKSILDEPRYTLEVTPSVIKHPMHAIINNNHYIHKMISYDHGTHWGIALCSIAGNCKAENNHLTCPKCIDKLRQNKNSQNHSSVKSTNC